MTSEKVVRSWKDEEYLFGLSEEERALIQENPAGLIEISDEGLVGIEGGSDSIYICAGLVLTVALSVAAVISAVVSHNHCR